MGRSTSLATSRRRADELEELLLENLATLRQSQKYFLPTPLTISSCRSVVAFLTPIRLRRKAIFVGDLVDRGPRVLDTLRTREEYGRMRARGCVSQAIMT